MDAESLKYLYKINIQDADDLKSFISGLNSYLDQILAVKRYKDIFTAQKRKRLRNRNVALSFDQAESFNLLLEFRFAYELAHKECSPSEVRSEAKKRGFLGANVSKFREAILSIDAPLGTHDYQYAVDYVNEDALRRAVRLVQNELLAKTVKKDEAQLWIEKIGDTYYYNSKKITFNNPVALYKKIFDLLYDYKKEGGIIEYVDLENYANDGNTKISRNSIFRALVQADATIKRYSSLPKKVGGKKLFQRTGSGQSFIFNNKR